MPNWAQAQDGDVAVTVRCWGRRPGPASNSQAKELGSPTRQLCRFLNRVPPRGGVLQTGRFLFSLTSVYRESLRLSCLLPGNWCCLGQNEGTPRLPSKPSMAAEGGGGHSSRKRMRRMLQSFSSIFSFNI